MKKLFRFMMALAVVAIAFACDRTPDNPGEGVTLSFSPKTQDMRVGDQLQLTVKAEPSTADLSQVKWASSSDEIASVDENGMVTAKAEGSVNIQASLGSATAICLVKVKPAIKITIIENPINLYVGLDKGITFTVSPSNVSTAGMTFTSANPSVAKVDNSGTVTGVAAGTTEVTLKLGNSEAKVTVNVEDPGVLPVQRKSILVEEFTGQLCVNCPYGTNTIHNAIRQLGEDKAVLVAHHVGYYDDNYTMAFSRPLESFYGTGNRYAPACMVDRTNWGEGVPAFFPSGLNAIFTKAYNSKTYADLDMTVELAADSTLTVKVNGDLMINYPDAHLIVYLTQDGVKAWQGSGGNSYAHPNMVRANLAGNAWGDTFDQPKGKFNKEYTFKIPAEIKSDGKLTGGSGNPEVDKPLTVSDLDNMYVVAFIADVHVSGLNAIQSQINNMKVHNTIMKKVR